MRLFRNRLWCRYIKSIKKKKTNYIIKKKKKWITYLGAMIVLNLLGHYEFIPGSNPLFNLKETSSADGCYLKSQITFIMPMFAFKKLHKAVIVGWSRTFIINWQQHRNDQEKCHDWHNTCIFWKMRKDSSKY